jgi:hypothetical protein
VSAARRKMRRRFNVAKYSALQRSHGQDVLPVRSVGRLLWGLIPQKEAPTHSNGPPIGNGAIVLRRGDYRGPGPDATIAPKRRPATPPNPSSPS